MQNGGKVPQLCGSPAKRREGPTTLREPRAKLRERPTTLWRLAQNVLDIPQLFETFPQNRLFSILDLSLFFSKRIILTFVAERKKKRRTR